MSVDGTGILHVIELSSPLSVWSTRAWIAKINKVIAVNNVQVKS
jgi:hypothetical protein